MNRTLLALLLGIGGILALPSVVEAYAGPGGVVTAIGAFVALVGAVFAAILGFFWYPVKRLAKWIGKGIRRTGDPDR